jgi:cellulose synthase/poly-beta-1,6-N-acetylglucosamine synthase-like glycosyltransferase
MLCLPPVVVDYIYFCVLLLATGLNCLIAVAWIGMLFRRHCLPQRPPAAISEADPISVIVPCYLPNEQTIIETTIEHILQRLEWDGPLTVFLVYNTPAPLPIEARLKGLDGREYAPRRVLRIIHAKGSTSKADNLNLVLRQHVLDDYVLLYDADHHPNRDSLRRLMRRLQGSDGACAVQGSTYIRNARGSLLARAVDAEFFVTHFVYFPAMEALATSGYFGGSNALWRTGVLSQYAFDHEMLTEDVDVSARALLDGRRICFCPEARSGELAPAGAHALLGQRLRWFMGWEQVTHKYYWRVFLSGLPWHRKAGFCYLFHLRWMLLLAAVLAAVVNPVITSPFFYPLSTWEEPIQGLCYTALSLYGLIAILGVGHAVHYDLRRRPLAVLAVVAFLCMGWVYVIVHFATHIVAFVKVFTGSEGGWKVTARSVEGMTPASSTEELSRAHTTAGIRRTIIHTSGDGWTGQNVKCGDEGSSRASDGDQGGGGATDHSTAGFFSWLLPRWNEATAPALPPGLSEPLLQTPTPNGV